MFLDEFFFFAIWMKVHLTVGDTDIDSLEEVRDRSEATVAEPASREAVRIVRSETFPVCGLPQGGVEDAGGRRADVSGSDTDSLVESDGDEHVHGSVASGEDDDIELPIVEPVALVFCHQRQHNAQDSPSWISGTWTTFSHVGRQ